MRLIGTPSSSGCCGPMSLSVTHRKGPGSLRGLLYFRVCGELGQRFGRDAGDLLGGAVGHLDALGHGQHVFESGAVGRGLITGDSDGGEAGGVATGMTLGANLVDEHWCLLWS